MPVVLERKHARQQAVTLIELLVAIVITAVVSTMVLGIWFALQRSTDFSEQNNSAVSTGRDALDRVSSELRDAQPSASYTASPFCLTLSTPYLCDGYDCTFYTPYNYAQTVAKTAANGLGASVLTSIYLDTSGTLPEKKLMMVRDLSGDGQFGSGDQVITLATNVVNTATSVNRPVFAYILDNSGTYSTTNTVTTANASAVVAVKIEIVVDTNMSAKPTYTDFVSTVRPRNLSGT